MSTVEFAVLDEDNYAEWSCSMRFFLTVKSLWHTISSDEAVNPDEDQKALGHIGLHVKGHHKAAVLKAGTARKAWDMLAATYQTVSLARRLQLKDELNHLTKSPKEPLTQYFRRATELRDQLAATDHSIDDQELIMCVLNGLPPQFTIIRSVLLTTTNKLELHEVLVKLLQEEQRIQREEGNTTTAYYSGNPKYSTGTAGSNPRTCYYCGKPGHVIRDCRKKKHDEQQRRQGDRRDTEPGTEHSGHSVVAAMGATHAWEHVAALGATSTWEHDWVLDSGASHHITGNMDLLTNIRKVSKYTTITFANGTTTEAKYMGDAFVKARGNKIIMLENVFYISSAAANLFSISQAINRGSMVRFEKQHCVIQLSEGIILVAKRSNNGLCTIPTMPPVPPENRQKPTPTAHRLVDLDSDSDDESEEPTYTDAPVPPSTDTPKPSTPATSGASSTGVKAEAPPTPSPATSVRQSSRASRKSGEWWKETKRSRSEGNLTKLQADGSEEAAGGTSSSKDAPVRATAFMLKIKLPTPKKQRQQRQWSIGDNPVVSMDEDLLITNPYGYGQLSMEHGVLEHLYTT